MTPEDSCPRRPCTAPAHLLSAGNDGADGSRPHVVIPDITISCLPVLLPVDEIGL